VTGPAFGPVTATVFIIIAMAREAFGFQLFIVEITVVAGVAFDPAMFPVQRIVSIPFVIETYLVPAFFRMTVATFRPVAPGMHIIQTMAAEAVAGYILVILAHMTTVAGRFRVLVTQYEVSLVVIKLRFPPAVLGVAVGTFIAEGTPVNIGVFMAGHAGRRRLTVFFIRGMTGFTARNSVCTLEGVVGGLMVKGFTVKFDDIGLAALVFGMAVPAFCFRLQLTPM